MLTKKELAEALGVSRVALNQWEREGAPVESVLERPVEEAVAALKGWRATHKRPRFRDSVEPDADGDLQQQLLAAQVREKNAAAAEKEIKNAIRLGELYDAQDVELQVSELCGLIRTRLESIPSELESEWPAEVRAQVTQRMADKIHLILTEMSQWRLGPG